MPNTISHRDWKVLLDSLKRGTCAVLVGQGLPVSDTDGTPRNLANALSRKLAEELETVHGLAVEDRDNLPLVAEFFLDRSCRDDLEIEVCDFYTQALRERPRNGVTDPTFDSLASLPFPLFVSSRHDLILEHYLQPRRPMVAGHSLRGDVQTTLGEEKVGTPKCPLVYHLLGSISDPESLVLTESELLDLLRSIACDDPPLPEGPGQRVRKQELPVVRLRAPCVLHAGAAAPAADDPISTAVLRARFHCRQRRSGHVPKRLPAQRLVL